MSSRVDALIAAAKKLSRALDDASFASPTAYVYNPLDYAWELHEAWLRTYGDSAKHTLLLGMNPGPWGMAQTGVPFGEIAAVRDWMKLSGKVSQPRQMHDKRKVEGLQCARSEASGRRLWGGVAAKYPVAADFFAGHFAVNYCPLLFLEESAKNRTPDKLHKEERQRVEAVCDQHLLEVCDVLEPQRVIGVGTFAKKCAERALRGHDVVIGTVLHPSPASPLANKGWAKAAQASLKKQGFDVFVGDGPQ